MSQENMSTGASTDAPNLIGMTDEVNKLMHDLENMVNKEQHIALTEVFAEWAVLSAMRSTITAQDSSTDGITEYASPSIEPEKGV